MSKVDKILRECREEATVNQEAVQDESVQEGTIEVETIQETAKKKTKAASGKVKGFAISICNTLCSFFRVLTVLGICAAVFLFFNRIDGGYTINLPSIEITYFRMALAFVMMAILLSSIFKIKK